MVLPVVKGLQFNFLPFHFRCRKYPDPEQVQQCKESLKLYYYEAESDYANAAMPTWDSETYTLIDTLAADETYDDTGGEVHYNREIRDVQITRPGVYFAFQDLGACSTIVYVKIYSHICTSTIAK